jgi:hypothetical protein
VDLDGSQFPVKINTVNSGLPDQDFQLALQIHGSMGMQISKVYF